MKNIFQVFVILAAIVSFSLTAFGQQSCVGDDVVQRMLKQLQAGKSPAVDQALKQELIAMRNTYVDIELYGVDDAKNADPAAIFSYVMSLGIAPMGSVRIAPIEMTGQVRDAFLEMGGENVSGTENQKVYDKKLAEQGKKNTARLCEIFSEKGWPSKSLVEKEGADALIFLLKTSAPAELQQKLAGLIAEGIKQDEVAKNIQTAALFDILLVRKGAKQLFGTQALLTPDTLAVFPMEDAKTVALKRKEYGLEPLSEALRKLEVQFHHPTVLTPQPYKIVADLKLPPEFIPAKKENPAPPKEKKKDNDDDDEPIRIETDLVDLDLTILDVSGRFNGELKQKDFVVFENGEKQEVTSFATTDAPYDLMLLIDVSSSTSYKTDLLINSTKQFINYKRAGDRVAIVTFASQAAVISPWSDNKKILLDRAGKITGSGGSQVWSSLKYALSMFDKNETGRRKAVVLMSDGADDALLFAHSFPGGPLTLPFAEVLETVRLSNIPVFPIYLDTEKDPFLQPPTNLPAQFSKVNKAALVQTFLKESYVYARKTLGLLAEESGGHFYKAAKLEDLNGVYKQVLSDLGMVYSVAYSPTNGHRDGSWREVRVEIPGHPELSVYTRPGYYAK